MRRAFELQNVDIKYEDGTVALRNVNLIVNYGEMVFLTGASGAGKTSVIRAVESSGYVSGGRVLFWGKDRMSMTGIEKRALYHALGVVYQDFKLIKHQSVLSNVMLPLRWVPAKKQQANRKSMQDRAKAAIKQVGLSGMEHKLAGLLSGGEQQRVAIARVLAKGCRMIVADEPTGNLDKENAQKMIALLSELASRGYAVLVTTHELGFVGSDSHYVVDKGTIHKVKTK